MSKKKHTARDLIERLGRKYSGTGYILMEQVRNGTGFGRRKDSYIDALVLSLWPSNGLYRMAFEVKVSRTDFLNELQNFDKNSFFKKYCHQFWFVAPSDVIKEEELPDGVGWMKPHGKKLSIVRHAKTKNKDDVKLDDLFLMSMCRNIQSSFDVAKRREVEKQLEESHRFQSAFKHQGAVAEFLKEHGVGWYNSDDKDKIKEELEKVLEGREVEDKKKILLEAANTFRNRLMPFYTVFSAIAHGMMTEADDFGYSILSRFRGIDEGCMEELIKQAKDKKGHNSIDAKISLKVRELMELMGEANG